MTIMTCEQHEEQRLLSLANALSKGIAEMDYKADKQRYLNYLREMTDLIIMAPANTKAPFGKQPPVPLYASTVDGEQPVINPVLFRTLHSGIEGA